MTRSPFKGLGGRASLPRVRSITHTASLGASCVCTNLGALIARVIKVLPLFWDINFKQVDRLVTIYSFESYYLKTLEGLKWTA